MSLMEHYLIICDGQTIQNNRVSCCVDQKPKIIKKVVSQCTFTMVRYVELEKKSEKNECAFSNRQ